MYFLQRTFRFHIIMFFLLWTVYEIFISPYIKGQNTIVFNFFNPTIKLFIWTLPVFIILQMKGKEAFSYLKLNNDFRNSIRFSVIAGIFIISYNLLTEYLFFGKFSINPFFDIDKWVNGVILVGFTEEILFRGYFLQQIGCYFTFWTANFITSVLFLLIHFPIWYVHATTIVSGYGEWVGLITFIFGFSMAQGYLFKKSNSLWPCILMHAINNFMVNAFVIVGNFPS